MLSYKIFYVYLFSNLKLITTTMSKLAENFALKVAKNVPLKSAMILEPINFAALVNKYII